MRTSAAGIATALRRAASAARAFVFDTSLPPLCPACGEHQGVPNGLCAACWSRLSFISRPYCERLGVPFSHDHGAGLLSPRAIAAPPSFGRARAAVRYDDVARTLVHALKYGDRLDLAPMMGRWMAAAGREVLSQADAVVPVPLHWRRLWARRFNQAAVLARFVAADSRDDRPLPVLHDVLQRVRATPQQVGLTRTGRAENVQSAFRVGAPRRGDVRGRRLVLVDDVMTSGATVDACARTLLRAGAGNVDVVVFACVVDATM